MILDELMLHNFGLYADRQTVTLTPPSADKPIVLFGGLNGGGKTTLLDALQLCLYGPHARSSNRGTLAYHEYLARSIHRQSRVREAALELTFRHTIDGREDHYRLHRSWRVTNHGCREHFEVVKNGHLEPTLAEHWISQVDEFIPPNIAHLFLFDGEQIEAYAAKDNSAALVAGAVQNLLGLEIVDQLEKDLTVFERRKRSDEKSDTKAADISVGEAAVRELRGRIEQLRQAQASLKTHQLDRKRLALAEVEDRYRNQGGDLYDQRTAIERAASGAAAAVDDGVCALREAAAGALPLVALRPLLLKLQHRDAAEEQWRRARDVIALLEDRDAEFLTQLRGTGADAEIMSTVNRLLAEDRESRQSLASVTTLLDLSPEVRTDLNALLREQLGETLAATQVKLAAQRDAEERAAQLAMQLDSVPSPDTLVQCITERDALKAEVAALDAKYSSMAEEIAILSRELERAQQVLGRLLETEAELRFHRDDRARILHHAPRVRATLSAFRQAVVARHIRRIEQFVLESYQQLLRKSLLVTRLSIDPASFALDLYGRDGAILSSERLSAGERQLLAIALLWGLAKASGRPMPTAIDTPLGRLDTSHRMHLVERYFPFASHQVLLFSTDEEITGAYLQRLKPWVGRCYALSYDDATACTTIAPGYFEERRAA